MISNFNEQEVGFCCLFVWFVFIFIVGNITDVPPFFAMCLKNMCKIHMEIYKRVIIIIINLYIRLNRVPHSSIYFI